MLPMSGVSLQKDLGDLGLQFHCSLIKLKADGAGPKTACLILGTTRNYRSAVFTQAPQQDLHTKVGA